MNNLRFFFRSGNQAGIEGGGFFFFSSFFTTSLYSNTDLNYNYAPNGGAGFFDSSSATLDGKQINLTGNSAEWGGALAIVDGTVFNLRGSCVFMANWAQNGGGIFVIGSTLTVAYGAVIKVSENKCDNFGGGVDLEQGSLLQVNGTIYLNGKNCSGIRIYFI